MLILCKVFMGCCQGCTQAKMFVSACKVFMCEFAVRERRGS